MLISNTFSRFENFIPLWDFCFPLEVQPVNPRLQSFTSPEESVISLY